MRQITDIFSIIASSAQGKADIEGATLFQKSEDHINSQKEVDNNTLLKQSLSIGGAAVNVFSNFLFGIKIPVYKGTIGDRIINSEFYAPKEATIIQVSDEKKDFLPKDPKEDLSSDSKLEISPFHETTRNIANGLISIANIGLFIATRKTLPYFDTNARTNIISNISNDKTAAGSFLKGISNWYKEQVTDKLSSKDPNQKVSLLGQAARGVVGLASGVNYLHEQYGNLIKSKLVYHTLNFGVGATLLTASGPVGWGIAGAAVAIDITRGAARVNRVEVKRDHLEHLTTISEAQKKILEAEKQLALKKGINIDKIRSNDPNIELSSKEKEFKKFLKDLGKPTPPAPEVSNTTPPAPGVSNKHIEKDELDRSVQKATIPTLLKEGISLGTAAATAAVNHVGIVAAGALAFLSFATNTKEILNEQVAKDAIKDKIFDLEHLTGYRSIAGSRQYELGAAAKEHAIYTRALESAVLKSDGNHYASEHKNEAETVLHRDERFNSLFSVNKIERPSSILSYAYRAANSTINSVASYLHPFKEGPTYAESYINHSEGVEKRKESEHKLQNSQNNQHQTSLTPERAAELNKEERMLEQRASETHTNTDATITNAKTRNHEASLAK